jgi:hypothetical protein
VNASITIFFFNQGGIFSNPAIFFRQGLVVGTPRVTIWAKLKDEVRALSSTTLQTLFYNLQVTRFYIPGRK